MSSNLAYARPAFAPAAPQREARPRHIEIVTTRAQRKARPRVAYAVITIASLFAIFAAQLLLSIVVSDGAYQLSNLQVQQKELLRTEQALLEKLQILGSTPHLAANAAHLGMVPGADPLYLDLTTGAVSSAPGTADPVGCGGGCGLVANSLMTGIPLVDAATAAAAQAAAAQAAPQPAALQSAPGSASGAQTGAAQPGAVAPAPAPAPAPTNPDVLPAPIVN